MINERQLRLLLREHVDYYDGERVHTELGYSPELSTNPPQVAM